MNKRIVFVYNADSGFLASAVDSFKKITKVSTGCALCQITHGVVREKQDWKETLKTLPHPTVFYHRDDIPTLLKKWTEQHKISLPVVLIQEGSDYQVILDAQEISVCEGDVNCFKSSLRKKL